MAHIERKNTLVKHSAAVHISNRITGIERKVYNVLLKNASGKLHEKEEYYIPLLELVKEVGWGEEQSVPQHIRSSIIKLVETSIQWNMLGRDKKRKWAVSTLLASAKISNGILHYSYSNDLRYLLSKPNVYTTLNLDYQKLLKSKYSLALWEFCCEQLDTSNARKKRLEYIDIKTLRSILGAEGSSYDTYKEFNKHILKRAVAEVNHNTDLEVLVLPHKEGKNNSRKISAISFQVTRKIEPLIPQMELFDDTEKEIDVIDLVTRKVEFNNLIGLGSKLNIDEEQVFQYLKEYSVEDTFSAFSLILEKVKRGIKIDNIGGYIWVILDKGITRVQSSDDVRSKVLELETQQKQVVENETTQQVSRIIQEEQDEIRKKVLVVCTEVIDLAHFMRMAETMRVVSYEQNPEEVLLCVFIDYKSIITKRHKLERALEEKFAIENKKVFVRIETDQQTITSVD